MDVLFFTPTGESWKMKPCLIDRSSIISTRVRRYFHKDMFLTILACVDYNKPDHIFYNLDISRPKGVDFPTTSNQDIEILHRMMLDCPVPIAHYEKCENKLQNKVARLKIEELKQRQEGLGDQILGKIDNTDICMDRKTVDAMAAADQPTLMECNAAQQKDADNAVVIYHPQVAFPSMEDLRRLIALLVHIIQHRNMGPRSGTTEKAHGLKIQDTSMYTPWATFQKMITGPKCPSGPNPNPLIVSNMDLVAIKFLLQIASYIHKILKPQDDIGKVALKTTITRANIERYTRSKVVPCPIQSETFYRHALGVNTPITLATFVNEGRLNSKEMFLSYPSLCNSLRRNTEESRTSQNSTSTRGITNEIHSHEPSEDLPVTRNTEDDQVKPTIKLFEIHIDEDDYCGMFGGILGVFARSAIHGDYAGGRGHVNERNI